MIPHRQISSDDRDWRAQLREAVTSPEELLSILGLANTDTGAQIACRDFPLLVPRSFIDRMEPGNPDDPLLRQVLPRGAELLAEPGYGDDPVGESGAANRRRGVIQKYRGRVLLLLAGGCAVNCRYCFRRHFPYEDNRNSRAGWQAALGEIARDESIAEVILSGGDPLLVDDDQLAAIADSLAAIPHVRRLRIHTRLPIVIPSRVTSALPEAITRPGLDTVVVLHSNHPRELDAGVGDAVAALRHAGVTVLNQAVLLAGVNDDADTQVALSETLFSIGVLPYYLHLLDRVRGAGHFDVDEERARRLLADITARLPGYLVPKMVREIAGEPAKSLVPPR